MNFKPSDLDRLLANPEKFWMELERRLESAWWDTGEQAGYLHSTQCPTLLHKEFCWHDCNPNGFEEAKEVSAWLGLAPERI